MLCGTESCINHHFHLVVEFHCAHDKKPGPPALGPGPLITELSFYLKVKVVSVKMALSQIVLKIAHFQGGCA